MADSMELLGAKRKVEDILLSGGTAPIVGVGASTVEDMINVYVTEITDKTKKLVSGKLGSYGASGHEVNLVQTGIVKSLSYNPLYTPVKPLAESSEPLRTTYHRPLMGGDSVGHPHITAGTLSTVVYDADTKIPYLLSNQHVFSASSSYSKQNAYVGDVILAPGCYDSPGGVCDMNYKVGKLYKFIPFNDHELNFVDAALVTPDNTDSVSNEVRGIGTITGHTKPIENMSIRKSGRTSGVSSATITDTHATLEVDFDGATYKFTNVVVSTPTAVGGDSGSLAVTSDNKACGLLFAGSEEVTCYNNILNVMNSLNVVMSPDDKMERPTADMTPDTTYNNAMALGLPVLGIAAFIGFYPAIQHQIELMLSRKF